MEDLEWLVYLRRFVLETSLGTTCWEPIAKTLAELNGFEIVTEKILRPQPFPKELGFFST
ncbi:hypothetical protein [Aphanizomenon flos-aquae]|uniref:Uncharacterized protein n=1 Tax=Aphanizomenon flos-aquae FACHB-1040 TaxID=2692887 RepID=A0ABR8BY29_APHFL|nr:hypothetical protein [Aphanizomenon flos-aquae]MBD2279838.1 hypothetical protein [Aphanizomenon flos-aquae FACHB-1040]